MKQWHEQISEENVSKAVDLVMKHLNLTELPEPILGSGKFPPVMKIRGLLHRDGTKGKIAEDDKDKLNGDPNDGDCDNVNEVEKGSC